MDASWTTTWSARARARRILRCVVLGCAVALMNSGLVSVISALFQLRTNYAIKEHEERGDFRAALGRLVLIDAALAGAAAFLVAYVAPAAQGSGLSELKGFLNGSRIPGLWRLRTFVVKYVAIALVIGSGLPVGREGPAAYLGGCVGTWAWRLVLRDDSERENDRKRLYATLGGAAGIATAFNAPVGGVLYVFEEISSYWDHEKTFYACLSTTVAVAAQKYLSQALHGASTRFQSLVIFDEAASVAGARWVWRDVPVVLVVALAAGAASALLTRVMLLAQRLRRRAAWRGPRFAKFAEAVAVCVVIGVAFFLLPKLGKCRARDDGHRRRRLAGGERHYRAYDCGAGRYNDLASLTLVGEEGAIKALLARDVARPFSGASLGVFVAAYFLCFSAIAGLSIPIGTFVPNMLLGAAVGRAIGDAAGELVGGLSGGGLFALVGAAAMLGGYTRLALTVAVLLVEATGDVGAAVPVLAASLVGSGASAALAPASYDDVLLHLRRVPYLEDAVPEATAALPVAAVCDAHGPRLRAREPAAAVAAAVEAERLYHLVVDGRGRHAGVASRQALAAALGRAERKRGDVVDSVRRGRERIATMPSPFARSPFAGGDASPRDDMPRRRLFGADGAPATPDGELDLDAARGDAPARPARAEGPRGDVDVLALADRAPYAVRADFPVGLCVPLVRKLQLAYVVVVEDDGAPRGLVERVHLLGLDLERLERIAVAAGDGAEAERSRRVDDDLELRAAGDTLNLRAEILGYATSASPPGPQQSPYDGLAATHLGRSLSLGDLGSPKRGVA